MIVFLIVVGPECIALLLFWSSGDKYISKLNQYIITDFHGQQLIDTKTAEKQQAEKEEEWERRGVRPATFCFVCGAREATKTAHYTSSGGIKLYHCSYCTPPPTILLTQSHHQPHGFVDASGVRVYKDTIQANDISTEIRFFLVLTFSLLGSVFAFQVIESAGRGTQSARANYGAVAMIVVTSYCILLAYW